MHSGVSKINMHHIGSAPTEDRDQHLIFAPIDQRRAALDKFHPAVTEQISVWPRNSFDVVKGKASGMFDLLRHDEGLRPPKGSDLPVNVQHFRLQKGGAITGNNKFTHAKPLTVGEVLPLV